MKREVIAALRGARYPLGVRHRVMMVFLAFLVMYLILGILHLVYEGKHYVLLALVALPALALGTMAARLIRIAVLSPKVSE